MRPKSPAVISLGMPSLASAEKDFFGQQVERRVAECAVVTSGRLCPEHISGIKAGSIFHHHALVDLIFEILECSEASNGGLANPGGRRPSD
jgi:hypothetical protein